MKRIVFFYTDQGSAEKPMPFDDTSASGNTFARLIEEEGYFYLLQTLKAQKVIDDALVIIVSTRSPGTFQHNGIKGYVVPHISQTNKYLRKEDIIWARGGWRSWHDYLIELQKKGHWLVIYAANTGRERWPFWDVILDDLNEENRYDSHARLWLHFKKPVNEGIFYPRPEIPKKYDICIGASHIHDRKAQWRVIQALHQCRESVKLKCVLPGRFKSGRLTNDWMNPDVLRVVNVNTPGMVPRQELAKIFAQSKLFVYLSGAGQGDRGPLEAMACGLPLFIGPISRLAPAAYNNPGVTTMCKDWDSNSSIAYGIKSALSEIPNDISHKASSHYRSQNGIQWATELFEDIVKFMGKERQSKESLKDFARGRNARIE